MATTTAFSTIQSNNHLTYGVATIDNGETATLAIPNHGRAVVRIGVPTITSASLTFTVTPYVGATARTLKDTNGNTVTIATSTGGFVTEIPELSGCYEFTIVSSGAQGAARAFDVQMVGLDPVPAGSNEITVEGGSITANQGTAGATPWPVIAAPSTSAIYNGTTAVTPVFAAISGASSGDNTLVSADATKKIRVFALSIVAAGAVNVRFESAAGGTALTGVMSFAANGGYVLPFNPAGWFETSANQLLNMELGGAVQVSGHLTYGLV